MDEQAVKEDILHILRILSSRGDFTQRDLSTRLGFSLGKTNYLLKELAKKGWVKMRNFSQGTQKLKKVGYYLTGEGLRTLLHLTAHYCALKEKEYLSLKAELEQIHQLNTQMIE